MHILYLVTLVIVLLAKTVMFTKVFKDNTIPCCSGNTGDVFLGLLSMFIEKHVNVAHQRLPATEGYRTATEFATGQFIKI